MGDAGYILFGWIGREVLSFGTILFAIFAVGGQLLAAQAALGSLSDNKLCLMWYCGIFAIPTLFLSLPRTLNLSLSWLSIPAVISIIVAAIVAMVGAGLHPVPGREISVTVNTSFYLSFISITVSALQTYIPPRYASLLARCHRCFGKQRLLSKQQHITPETHEIIFLVMRISGT